MKHARNFTADILLHEFSANFAQHNFDNLPPALYTKFIISYIIIIYYIIYRREFNVVLQFKAA